MKDRVQFRAEEAVIKKIEEIESLLFVSRSQIARAAMRSYLENVDVLYLRNCTDEQRALAAFKILQDENRDLKE